MKYSKNIIWSIFAVLLISNTSFSQSTLSAGSDFVSRYLWRGLDFGNSFSLQPSMAFTSGDFEVGIWGSYPLTTTSNGSEEIDFYASYSIADFSLIVTDYYFPNNGIKIGNFKDGGAHTLEVGLSYGGSESIPISLAAYINVSNDDDKSVYFELGYSTEVNEVGLNIFIGGTPGGENTYYETTKFNLINIGATVSREINITENFSLPVFTTFIVNPNQEVGYLLFGFSLNI